jgi:hypothetical protein
MLLLFAMIGSILPSNPNNLFICTRHWMVGINGHATETYLTSLVT